MVTNIHLKQTEKNQSGLKNTITEMKKHQKELTDRLGDTEQYISKLEDRKMEIAQSEQEKEKQILKNEDR